MCAFPRLLEPSSSDQRSSGALQRAGLESSIKQGASSRNEAGGVLRGFSEASEITERDFSEELRKTVHFPKN